MSGDSEQDGNVARIFESFSRSSFCAGEDWVRLHVQPPPSWMPKHVHAWLLSKILVQEHFIGKDWGFK